MITASVAHQDVSVFYASHDTYYGGRSVAGERVMHTLACAAHYTASDFSVQHTLAVDVKHDEPTDIVAEGGKGTDRCHRGGGHRVQAKQNLMRWSSYHHTTGQSVITWE